MNTSKTEIHNNVARVKAENYRKKLRKVLLEYLQWMRAMKKDSTFRNYKVIQTQQEVKDTEGFDWPESNKLYPMTKTKPVIPL